MEEDSHSILPANHFQKYSEFHDTLPGPHSPSIEREFLKQLHALLQDACFDFGQRAMPELMRQERWFCPESVELKKWYKEFLARRCHLGNSLIVSDPPKKQLKKIQKISLFLRREEALSLQKLKMIIHEAETLTKLLGNTSFSERVKRLNKNMAIISEELQRHRRIIQERFDEINGRIMAKRANLDELEKAAFRELGDVDKVKEAYTKIVSQRRELDKIEEAAVADIEADERRIELVSYNKIKHNGKAV